MQIEWDKFSKSINGKVDKSKESYENPNNIFKITTDKNQIELTWGNRPEKGRGNYVTLETRLKYELNIPQEIKLKICPNDFFAKTISLFSKNKQKTGIKDLDSAYVFICSSNGLINDLAEEFKIFYRNNSYKNFTIDVETITDKPFLSVFIPELITTQKTLAFYYTFGLQLVKKINGIKV